jgi:hypothetical protein
MCDIISNHDTFLHIVVSKTILHKLMCNIVYTLVHLSIRGNEISKSLKQNMYLNWSSSKAKAIKSFNFLLLQTPKDSSVTQNQPLAHTLRQHNLIYIIHYNGIKILNTCITQHKAKLRPWARSFILLNSTIFCLIFRYIIHLYCLQWWAKNAGRQMLCEKTNKQTNKQY